MTREEELREREYDEWIESLIAYSAEKREIFDRGDYFDHDVHDELIKKHSV